MTRRKRRRGERCGVCHEWSPDHDKARQGACLGRGTLFQTADCAFGYQIIEGYEVVRASHWCERFKAREKPQGQEIREEEKEQQEQKGSGLV
jgi:hypothetical protein